MERGTGKYRNTVKQIDEVNDCNVFQKDSDKFVKVEAEAGAAKNSANDARRIPKKKLDKKHTDSTPVNIENLKKKWGKWYIFGENEDGQYTAKCKACSSWYVGINKKQLPVGTPMRGYEYTIDNPIRHGKQKLGWDGHLKDKERKQYSKRAHWRAVRGLETQKILVSDQSTSQDEKFSSGSKLSKTTKRDTAASLQIIGLQPSNRKIERIKRGLEVLSRMAYITTKADMPISKFQVLRNALQQSQLTMLADCHERVEAISSRLNDFYAVMEIQIRGLRTLVDTNLTLSDP